MTVCQRVRGFDNSRLLIWNNVISIDGLILFHYELCAVYGNCINCIKCWSITCMLWFIDLSFALSIVIMFLDKKTRTKKQEEGNNTSVIITNLETKLSDRFSSLKDEVINLKDKIKRNGNSTKLFINENLTH